MKRDNAFTGLEAAIVLIAFVVVAAVFSYVMLGAGFFATQKAQEVTYAGIKQTTSNLIPDGIIYGNMSQTAPFYLDKLQISLSVPIGGQAQDIVDMTIAYTSSEQGVLYNFLYDDGTIVTDPDGLAAPGANWAGNFIIKSITVPGTLVGPGESCEIILYLDDASTAASVAKPPKTGGWFQVEIKPGIGAPTTIRKIIPTGYVGGKLV